MFSLEICYGYDKWGAEDLRMAEQEESAHPAPGIADQRRGQMLRAALDVISERGFADTRIADIAERIGISPALVIYYFKTKDQLLTEAIRHYEDTWYAEGQRRMDKLGTAAERLEEFVAMNLLPDRDPDLAGSCGWTSGLRPPGMPTWRLSGATTTSAGVRSSSRWSVPGRRRANSATSIRTRSRSSFRRCST